MKTLRCWQLGVSIGISFFASEVLRASPVDEGWDTDESLPVVLSASRLKQPLREAPAAITVIDREMIEASGARNIPDVLRLAPGFMVGYGNGNSATVTNQGLGDSYSRQMQVLIDGRSVYSPLFGGVYWSDLPIVLEDVDRIEVVRGPNAASFGANSFLGVINIITREPSMDKGNRVTLTRGSEGIYGFNYRHGGGDGVFNYRASVSQQGDSGFKRLNDDQRTSVFNFRSEYHLDQSNAIQTNFGLVSGDRQEGDSAFPIWNGPRDRAVSSGYLQTRWSNRSGSTDELWVQYSYDYRKSSEFLEFATASIPSINPVLLLFLNPKQRIDFSSETVRHDIELQNIKSISEDLRITTGGQIRQDGARSYGNFHTDSFLYSNLARMFGHMEWRLAPGWVLNAGAMLEKTTYTASEVSPRLALNWAYAPAHSVRFAWGKAERTPTILESRANYGIWNNGINIAPVYYQTKPLRAEKIESVEGALLGDFKEISLNYEVRSFWNNITDLIGVTRVPYPGGGTVNTFINRDFAVIRGFDFSFKWNPWDGTQVHYTGSRMTSTMGMGTPSFTDSILISQAIGAETTLSTGFYQTDQMAWGGGGIVRGFHKLDMKLARRLYIPGLQKAEIAVVAENIVAPSADWATSSSPASAVFLQLALEF